MRDSGSDTAIAKRLAEALRQDPISGWLQVIEALPALGITGPERRALIRDINDLIQLRRRWQRLRRQEHP